MLDSIPGNCSFDLYCEIKYFHCTNETMTHNTNVIFNNTKDIVQCNKPQLWVLGKPLMLLHCYYIVVTLLLDF